MARSARRWPRGADVWGTNLTRPASITSVHPLRMDLADPTSVRGAVEDARPEWVVHAAAWPDLARCEREPAMARCVNVGGTGNLARACREVGSRLIYLSTDQVFDGERGGYRETDKPRPINAYGLTKLEGEHAAHDLAGAVVVRLGLVYALRPGAERTPVEQILAMIRRGQRPGLFTDEIRSPILIDDVVGAVARIVGLSAGASAALPPVLHLGGPDAVSRYELGQAMADRFGFDPGLIEARFQGDFASPARRPRDCSMDSGLARVVLGLVPRHIREGLAKLAAETASR